MNLRFWMLVVAVIAAPQAAASFFGPPTHFRIADPKHPGINERFSGGGTSLRSHRVAQGANVHQKQTVDDPGPAFFSTLTIGSETEGCNHQLQPGEEPHQHLADLSADGRAGVFCSIVATPSAAGSTTKHRGSVHIFSFVDGVETDHGTIEAKVEFTVGPGGLIDVETDQNEFIPVALAVKYNNVAFITAVSEAFSETMVVDNDFTSIGNITVIGKARAKCPEEDP